MPTPLIKRPGAKSINFAASVIETDVCAVCISLPYEMKSGQEIGFGAENIMPVQEHYGCVGVGVPTRLMVITVHLDMAFAWDIG